MQPDKKVEVVSRSLPTSSAAHTLLTPPHHSWHHHSPLSLSALPTPPTACSPSLFSPPAQLANAECTTATLRLHGEDHTLGNSLRYVLAKAPTTDFVGYSIPHPSEHVIHLRLQTRRGKTVLAAVREACSSIEQLCDHISDTFTQAEQRAIQEGRDRGEQDDDDQAAAEDHHMEEID